MQTRTPLGIATPLSVPSLLFIMVGALGCVMLLLSAILPYDDLVQQECAPKTWCDGSGATNLERAQLKTHQAVFVLPPVYDHAPTGAARATLSQVIFHASTALIEIDHSRGPPMLPNTHDSGSIPRTDS
jgi:hypothetical protein